jgi:aminomethyltransferase
MAAENKLWTPGSGVNPSPGILQYPRIRKSPYFYASRQHGVALYSVYNNGYHPRHYGDPVAEYWKMVRGVVLYDVGAAERQLEVTGPDAFDFVNSLVPRDLYKCAVDQCKYVFVTGPDGGIMNDPVLLRLGENHFWLSLADSNMLYWLMGQVYKSSWNVTVREPDVAPVQVQGPKSKEVIANLFGDTFLGTKYYNLFEAEVDGMSVVVSRSGFTAELGYEIYLRDASKNGNAIRLWNAVLQAGEPHNIMVTGPGHIRRTEAGMISWGNDAWYARPEISEKNTDPFEVGYGFEKTWMVDLEQGADFVGKSALIDIKAERTRQIEIRDSYDENATAERGVQRYVRDYNVDMCRQLVGIEFYGPKVGSFNDGSMIDFYPVDDPKSGQKIGFVTTAVYSPRLERNIGYANVPITHAPIGRRLVVHPRVGDEDLGPQDAIVVTKPFVDPNKDAPKA